MLHDFDISKNSARPTCSICFKTEHPGGLKTDWEPSCSYLAGAGRNSGRIVLTMRLIMSSVTKACQMSSVTYFWNPVQVIHVTVAKKGTCHVQLHSLNLAFDAGQRCLAETCGDSVITSPFTSTPTDRSSNGWFRCKGSKSRGRRD